MTACPQRASDALIGRKPVVFLYHVAHMSDSIPVTVVVPVKNEARNLPRCLKRLERFEKVYVVDSGSDDATPEVAESHGAEVVQFKWNGRFPKKRNWFLDNHTLGTEWVLFSTRRDHHRRLLH